MGVATATMAVGVLLVSFLSLTSGQGCQTNLTCSSSVSCFEGSTRYCCVGGHVTLTLSDGQPPNCVCRTDKTGSDCPPSSHAASLLTSASGLTCALATCMAIVTAARWLRLE